MKLVKIGDTRFSKVICGTNPFLGRSHFSAARDAEYAGRYDDEAIEQTIMECLRRGVNTIESSASERMMRIRSRVQDSTPEPIHFVGNTRIDETSEMKSHQAKLSFLIENRAAVCVIHAQYVDRPRRGDSIGGLERLVDKIHEAGLLAGISTHKIETVELCENQGYGIDTYLFPLNLSGFAYPGYEGKETVQDRVDLVRSVNKPFILIKVLAAGRIPPDEGLQFVAENSKPNDLIDIGFGTDEEAAESIELVEKYF
jgi:hypothetical protein